jgi:myo-inositol-1-phosphate synthase
MKFKILTAVAAAVLLSAFTPFSFAEKDLVGAWKMDAKSVDKMVKLAIKKAVEANPGIEDQIEENRSSIVDVMSGIRITIKADHTYETVTSAQSASGKWALVNKDRAIIFTKADGSTRRDTILESSATTLKTINGQLKDTLTYIHP